MIYVLAITIALGGLFWIVRKKTNTGLGSGFIFHLFLMCFLTLVLLAFIQFESNIVVYFLLLAAIFLIALVLLLGVYILLAFLIVNSVMILKRERFSLAHILTLILAVCILFFMVITTILDHVATPPWVFVLWNGLVCLVIFYVSHIMIFIETLILVNVFRPVRKLDYIIVLGSGLVDGKVPPLLANRIKAALKFAAKQQKAGRNAPYLLLSGGQGTDEPRPEAEAMNEYAVGQGYDAERILTETESVSTLENMRFSKQLMDEHSQGKKYRCGYATSSYHLLRAGLLARRVGLKMSGIGGKTAFYYIPNAVLREYIAYLSLYKKRFIVITVLVFMIGVIFAALIYSFGQF